MENNTTKNNYKQNKTRRRELIEAAQAKWHQEMQELEGEKTNLGLQQTSLDDFLAMSPDNFLDITKQSQIISLQEKYQEMLDLRTFIWAEDTAIEELNKIHAIVHPGQTYILTEKVNPLGGWDFSLESRQSFKTYYEDETIMCIDEVERAKADIWLKSPKRRKYKDITFDPITTDCTNGNYNLWKGFAKAPQQGDCSKYWAHLKENICSNDEKLYIYIRKWLAHIFQHPEQVHTALVLCGSQGVGKNSFVDPLGVLLGSHYAPLSSISELVSNFNYHLKNAVLIHANEALWGGNKKELGTVKAMITESICLIEGKGKDRIQVRNFKHIILSSNEDWPVHLDPDDRRFVVIQVSEQRKEDHEYFQALSQQLNSGGYEALLYDLLHEDLTEFNPRKLPISSASFAMKMRSAEAPHRYIYEALNDGSFCIGSEDVIGAWQPEIPKDSVYKDFVAWCDNNGEQKTSKERFGKILKKLIPPITDSRPGGQSRTRCYKLPSLTQAQEEFCTTFKEKREHIFDNDGEIEHSPGHRP